MEGWGPELAILLGLVEGLTEFLPVSSTGHLILVGHWLGFSGEVATSVDMSIQLGAILAVIVYERTKIATLLRDAAREQALFRQELRERRSGAGAASQASWRSLLTHSMAAHPSLWFLLGLGAAFVPAGLLGLVAHKWIEAHLFTPQTVAAALIAGGIIILAVERSPRPPRVATLDQVGLSHACWVGLAQCLSLFPGVSRSGATIMGGLLVGMDRKVATEYSFFLALPTMIAATTYKMIKSRALLSEQDAWALGLGLIVAFLVAWGVIAVFLAYVKRHRLSVFAYYRIVLGVIVLLVIR
jgi:undecaprenyl-diphosphatase